MNRLQIIYISGTVLVLGFMVASLATGEMWYLIPSSICIALFGFGGNSEKYLDQGKPFHIWQLLTAIYLAGLAIFHWLNMQFVRDYTMASFGLFVLPFLPVIIQSEYRKFHNMGKRK